MPSDKDIRDAFMRHPAADYIMERVLYAIHPLIEEIESLEERLEGSRQHQAHTMGSIKKEQMREYLRDAAKALSKKKVIKIMHKTTGEESFLQVKKTQYPDLLAAIDKAMVKHNTKGSK